MIFKQRRVSIKNLSPSEAWNRFVDMNEEKFIAFMRPTTDIKEMCQICASELPLVFEYEKILFTTKTIKEIGELLNIHLTAFVNNKGGYDSLDLMSEDEIEDYFDEQFEKSIDHLANYFNCSPEEIYMAIDKFDAD